MGKNIQVDLPTTVQARVAAALSVETRTDASPTDSVMQLFVPASIKIGSSAVFYRSGITAVDANQDLSSYAINSTYPMLDVGDKTICHVGVEISGASGAAIVIPVLYYDHTDKDDILSIHRDLSFAAGFFRRTASGKYIAPFQEIMIGAARGLRLFVKYLESGQTIDIVAGIR